MAESHIISGLVSKRAEIAGLVAHHQAMLDRLTGQLGHIDATIKLFDPEYNISTIRPRTARERDPRFSHGETGRLILEAFREQAGKATTRQITDYILSRKGIELTTEAIGNMQKRVNAHLKRDKGAYRIGGHDQEGVSVWALTL